MLQQKELDQKIENLDSKIIDLIESAEGLPVYEIGVRLIAKGVSLLLFYAPKPEIAKITIEAAIKIGTMENEEMKKHGV